MKKWVSVIMLVGIGAYFLGGSVQHGHDTFQGKTAEQWARIANDLKTKVSQEEAALTIYQTLDSASPTPTVTLPPASNLDSNLPSWCQQVIGAWVAQGYSRATTNQLMKKDNPECTY